MIYCTLSFFGSVFLFVDSIMLSMNNNFTKVEALSDKEFKIKTLIKSGNPAFVNAFNFIHKMYKINSSRGRSNHYNVFKSIYIDEQSLPAWQLANICHIAESSLYRLRNDIIDFFYAYLEEYENASEEIAATEG